MTIKAEDGSKFSVKPDESFNHRLVLLTLTKVDGTQEEYRLLPYDAEILATDLHHAAVPKKK